MSQAQLNAERAVHNEVVRQTTNAFKEAKKGNDQALIDSTKLAMLEAIRDRSKLNGVTSTRSKSGKKKKNRVKIDLDSDQEFRLENIETNHRKSLRDILDKSENHQAYCQSIHDEFVEFAQEKITFYQSLPQSDAREKKIAIAEKYYEKCRSRPVDTVDWDGVVFSQFKKIMQEYRADVQEVRDHDVYASKFKSQKIKDLRKARTKTIKDLLVQNGLYLEEQARAGR